jgi:hypothetical protein
MFEALSVLTTRDKVIATLAIGWNVVTAWVLVVGERPDWALLMIMVYGCFTVVYCMGESREVEVTSREN